jgi:hypothetical protein
LANTIADAATHCQELLPWCGKNSIQTIQANNVYLIYFVWTVGGALIKAG